MEPDRIWQILQVKFPFSDGNIPFAMSYGSMARQHAELHSTSMLDFVFGVRSSADFHRLNLEKNFGDYPPLIRLAYNTAPQKTLQQIVHLQEQIGGRLWYHSHITVPGLPSRIKYGVINVDHLKKDLTTWETLYIAGRMHKPVTILKDIENIKQINTQNLRYAVDAALMLLPERFSAEELFTTISRLSYLGDIRVGLAEDPEKIKKIVGRDFTGFEQLYQEVLRRHPQLVATDHKDFSPQTVFTQTKFRERFQLQSLPPGLGQRIVAKAGSADAFLRNANAPQLLVAAISDIVKQSSRSQSAKGILSVPLLTSLSYLFSKITKRLF